VLDKDDTKDRARLVVQPLVRLLARLGVAPNTLTLIGLLLNAGVGLIIAAGYPRVGGILLLFTSGFDLLDGALAKATGRKTKFGAFLDSTLDRYSEAAVLFGLLWLSVQRSLTLDIFLVYVVIVGSLLVSYTRARAEGLVLQCRVGWLGRPERIIVLSLGLILNLIPVALVILAVFTHFTALQRMAHVWRETGGR